MQLFLADTGDMEKLDLDSIATVIIQINLHHL
jgi:hypothetical protein